MFRRLWTGLPPTPKFSTDLEKLGYFINEEDQLRNLEDPKYYYKYFITRNTYYNDSQRFSFHTAIQRIVLGRLAELGVHPVRLPLGARDDEPHLHVLASNDLATADRVVMFVGETAQDLGVLAYRVTSGSGGIDKGSIVSMVCKMRGAGKDDMDKNEKAKPAILICNPGELFWWPEAQRSLSLPAVEGMPRPSAAHWSPHKYAQNTIPGHETADAHIASVFQDLLSRSDSSNKTPRITAIAIAGGADALETFLDHPERWQRWGPHMDSLAVLGGLYEEHHIKTDAFKAFLRQRARAYISSEAPVDTPVSGPDGNDQAARATRFGCPVHSAGTTWLTELMFIEAQSAIIEWGEAVACNPMYVNPQIAISYAETILTAEDTTWVNYKEEGADDDETKQKEEEGDKHEKEKHKVEDPAGEMENKEMEAGEVGARADVKEVPGVIKVSSAALTTVNSTASVKTEEAPLDVDEAQV
ncbi:mitochondrial 40s ribosomal protein mrp2 [Ophiostoma piceae UAMH 11346]|uniref:Mitochondrial 40s ribosomal protein mrp2 n=1 Tax=Ophiostoma piceae (strain UAMH 11346) TaxID=1262450 RepID=S3C8V4_OPHP1|nr:mitochondrial 40s ribosomal protein mrp2 [Ophiostoma piceae UAMH 11346]